MYQLNPASLDSDNNKNESKGIYKKSSNLNNKTYKNRGKSVNFSDDENNKNKLTDINNLLSKLHSSEEGEENEDNTTFRDQYNEEKTNNSPKTAIENELKKLDTSDTVNYLNGNINSNFASLSESYKNNISYLNNMNDKQKFNAVNNSNIEYDNNKLLTKLDYIIHLLEEQHNEKTNHITEELILYLFLGIFIIFVLDSFARASKYIR